ncbi:MAG: hypothetical protein ABJF89_06940 [Parasphingorhabdus sp.]|uniref:hypothetical protein n=1 Tax=Parasphingorhabdus sp. TaxID=2709688 RepID=UPI00326555FB
MTYFAKVVAAIAAPLLLTGCLVTPGQFESELVLQKSGEFSFAYEGEISILGMQKLINVAAESEEDEFEPKCFKDTEIEETAYQLGADVQSVNGQERECTEAEAEEQLKELKRENERMTGLFQALFGGMDPSTPDALEELLIRTRKQKGWEKIDHRGDGVFDVKYLISGRLDRNFTFPHLEQTKGANAFLEAIVRNDDKIRIEAPGFAQLEQNSGIMQLGTLAAMGDESKNETAGFGEEDESILPAGFTKPNGTFKIITDAEILTNNTEEGPETEGGMKILFWNITERTSAPPMALIKIAG